MSIPILLQNVTAVGNSKETIEAHLKSLGGEGTVIDQRKGGPDVQMCFVLKEATSKRRNTTIGSVGIGRPELCEIIKAKVPRIAEDRDGVIISIFSCHLIDNLKVLLPINALFMQKLERNGMMN